MRVYMCVCLSGFSMFLCKVGERVRDGQRKREGGREREKDRA